MTVYLHDIPLDQAQARFQQALEEAGLWKVLETETIQLDENAVARVLSAPVWARICSPHYHASAMDGFALRASATAGALPSKPVTLHMNEESVYVDTGDPLPDWANAVVPVENVEALDEEGNVLPHNSDRVRNPVSIRLRAALTPWQHVRPVGEDIVASQLVLPAGQVLRPVDLGAGVAAGHQQVQVSRPPRVAILPTGTELVTPGTAIKAGDIIEYNSLVLAAQIMQWGGQAERFSITPDDFDLIKQRVQQAADRFDLVLLNAGSSAGSEDFSARVVEELGQLLVHGVAVRPGHPVILGMIRRSTGGLVPIIGVPGYPVSAALTGEIFVEPLIARWLGRAPSKPVEVQAHLTRKVVSPPGDDDYLRVVVGRVGDQLLAAPLTRGAGVITSLVRADGIAILPRGVQGMEAGSPVRVRLYRHPADLDQTLFATGSHDMSLDILAERLAGRGRRLVSSNVGSQGGLVALRRREAHLAGSHLLDPDTGEYNLSFLPQYLADTPVMLMVWVGREQGLLVPMGNPKGIKNIEDLARPDVIFSNRQRGAGTRVLLDYVLKQHGITPEQVNGYAQEEYTHLGVAAAVSSHRADCGLGIAAAANALNLDFIPLFIERYDLVIPCEYVKSGLLDPLFELAREPDFQNDIRSLPGYDVSRMGEVILPCT